MVVIQMRLRTSKYYCLLFTVFSWSIAVAIIQKVILKVRQLLWMRHLLKWGYYLKKTFRHGLGNIGRIGTYYIGEAIIWMRHVLGKIFFSSFLRQLLTWGNYWCEAINHENTVSLLGNDHPYYANHIGLSLRIFVKYSSYMNQKYSKIHSDTQLQVLIDYRKILFFC